MTVRRVPTRRMRCAGWRRCAPSIRCGRHRRRRLLRRVAQSGRASWRRALCTRRCASGPESLHMCLMTVFAEKNPWSWNGFDRSTAPAAATDCGVDRAAELLDTLQPGPQLDRVELRGIDITQRGHRNSGSPGDVGGMLTGRFGVERLHQPQPDRIETRNPTASPRRRTPRSPPSNSYPQS